MWPSADGRGRLRAAMAGVIALGGTAASADDMDALMQREPWESCSYCHGADGRIDDPQVPPLAGQSAAYLVKQLGDFRSGRRVDPSGLMGSAMFLLDAADDARVAAYFAALPAPTHAPGPAQATGARLFRGSAPGVAACQGCHQPGMREASLAVPRLEGLSAGYLARQLRRFRAAERRNDPAGLMRGVAATLSDIDIDALADYLGRR